MTKEETNDLINRIKSGDNKAWDSLYSQYAKLIHKWAWGELKGLNIPDERKHSMEEDLFQAGWLGFVGALKNYDPDKGSLSTLASHYAKWEIKRERSFLLNSLGLTEMPKRAGEVIAVSIDEEANEKLLIEMERALETDPPVSLPGEAEGERFSARRLALQLLLVIKSFTDEEHTITQEELFEKLRLYRIAKYNNSFLENRATLSAALKDLLSEITELSYYEKKQGEISNLYYSHPFKDDELDEIIHLIAYTDMISVKEKEKLIEKLVSTAGLHYRTPFWDGEKLRFDPRAVYGRFSSRNHQERRQQAENIKVLQYAVNNLWQVRFRFNRYNSAGQLEPVSEYEHKLSPYHMVVYHDNFYCIGLKNDDNRIWHYRVDLMTDVEILRDEAGRPLPIRVCDFPGLPIGNSSYNPEKYMAEHLNMAYDDPRDIRIKIKHTSHTILHDWFGNHYEMTDDPCDEGYDIVKLRTSPSMIVHWAMQYGTAVEILDEDIRAKLMEEVEKLGRMYGRLE